MKTPMLARALRRYGARVTAYLGDEGARYVAPDALRWATDSPITTGLTSRSEHLSKADPFDAYVVAPATYNTINKCRYGVADTLVTTALASAFGLMERGSAKVLMAPTMHGDMHNSVLQESLLFLRNRGVILIPPRDAYGKHNLPDAETIVAYTCAALSDSKLKNKRILVTGGPTPRPSTTSGLSSIDSEDVSEWKSRESWRYEAVTYCSFLAPDRLKLPTTSKRGASAPMKSISMRC